MSKLDSDRISMELSQRIKNRRIKMNLSYADISKKTGLSRSTLLRYENGKIKNIPADKIELLAEVFNMNPIELMGWENSFNDNKLNTSEENLILDFRKLNNLGKNKVIEYTKDISEINKYTTKIQISTTCSKNVCKISTNPEITTRRAHNDYQDSEKEQELMNEDFEMMKQWKKENNK